MKATAKSSAGPRRKSGAGSLLAGFREQWQALRHSSPGHRFQERYTRNRRQGRKGGRITRLILGTAAVLAGLFLMVVPGPGLPVLVVGAGLLATDSLPAARFLDWTELKLRPTARWLHRHWRKLPVPARVVLACCSTALSLTAAYFLPKLLSGG